MRGGQKAHKKCPVDPYPNPLRSLTLIQCRDLDAHSWTYYEVSVEGTLQKGGIRGKACCFQRAERGDFSDEDSVERSGGR